jgi:hypothetical protein
MNGAQVRMGVQPGDGVVGRFGDLAAVVGIGGETDAFSRDLLDLLAVGSADRETCGVPVTATPIRMGRVPGRLMRTRSPSQAEHRAVGGRSHMVGPGVRGRIGPRHPAPTLAEWRPAL